MDRVELKKKLEEMIELACAARKIGDEIANSFDADDYIYDTLNEVQDCEITDAEEAMQAFEGLID